MWSGECADSLFLLFLNRYLLAQISDFFYGERYRDIHSLLSLLVINCDYARLVDWGHVFEVASEFT